MRAQRTQHHLRLAVQLSVESGGEKVECGDNQGRPEPQPQESLKNARQASDVIRRKEEIISFEEEIMLYNKGEG